MESKKSTYFKILLSRAQRGIHNKRPDKFSFEPETINKSNIWVLRK